MLGNMGHSSPSNEAVTSRDRKRTRKSVDRPRPTAQLARKPKPTQEGAVSLSRARLHACSLQASQKGGGVWDKGQVGEGFSVISEIFFKNHSETWAEGRALRS